MYNFQDTSCSDSCQGQKSSLPFRALNPRQTTEVRSLLSFLDKTHTLRQTSYKNKIEIVGNKIVATEYETPVREGYTSSKASNRGESLCKEENQKRSAQRARATFIDKVDSTFAFIEKKYCQLVKKGWRLRFLTLTYKEEVEDRNKLAGDWDVFMHRLRRYFVTQGLCTEDELEFIHYAAVPEIQKRRQGKTDKAVWHLHILLFSPRPQASKIYKELWTLGGNKIKLVTVRKLWSLGGYLAKYMGKDFMNETFDKKRFFTSRNVRCYKVRWVQNVDNMNKILSSFKKYVVREIPFSYRSEFHGIVTGKTLYLKRTDEVYQLLLFLLE